MNRIFCPVPMVALAFLALAAPVWAAGEAPPPAAHDSAAVNLRPKFRQGQVSRYDVWTVRDQAITVSLGPRSETAGTRIEVRGEMTWSIDRVGADGSATCVMTTDWLTAELTDPTGGKQLNDSRKPNGPTEPVHRLLRAMCGVPMRVEMAADGTPQSVTGVDAVRRAAGADLHVPDELDFLETAADLATSPSAPVAAAIGQNWEATFNWNHDMGKLRHDVRYGLVSVEEIAGIPVATVTGTEKLHLEPDLSKLPAPPGGKVDVRLVSGTGGTQIMMDLQRGEAVGRNSFTKMQIEARLSVQGQTMARTIDESIQSQALRISEK